MRRRLLSLLLLVLAGCHTAMPVQTSFLGSPNGVAQSPPHVTLVRAAFQRKVTREGGGFVPDALVPDEDLFGKPGALSDPSCIAAGIQRTLPNARFVATGRFWNTIVPGRERLPLAELLAPPLLERLTMEGVDYLVIASHRLRPTEYFAGEFILEGGIGWTMEQKAAALLIDLASGALVDAAEARLQFGTYAFHTLVVLPLFAKTYPAENPCSQLGALVANRLEPEASGATPTFLVVAGEDDLYEAVSAP